MQARDLHIEEIIAQFKEFTFIDVRSEHEFQKGAIVGSLNVPVLSNEERKIIGTLYKNEGRIAAVREGLHLVGPKMATLFDRYDELNNTGKPLLFYCWRGGLRSLIASSLYQWSGVPVYRISGGYKSYRTWILEQFAKPFRFQIIGGSTGSGKTEVLHLLKERGEQVIDLEKLAHHKGSAFGSLGQENQPFNESFENALGWELGQFDRGRVVWIENESRLIGTCFLPESLWQTLQKAPIIQLQVPLEIRVQRLIREYAHFDTTVLAEKTEILRKKLGGQHVQHAIACLKAGDYASWIKTLLVYYDKTYAFGVSKNKDRSHYLSFDWEQKNELITQLIEYPWN
jgi:tRNA 2-selenouridine synthase